LVVVEKVLGWTDVVEEEFGHHEIRIP